jgi:hypothetical protein
LNPSILGSVVRRQGDLVPIRRLYAKQIVDEVVIAIVLVGQNAHSVILARNV